MQDILDIDLGVLTIVQETVPSNWVLEDIKCTGGNQNQFVIDVI